MLSTCYATKNSRRMPENSLPANIMIGSTGIKVKRKMSIKSSKETTE